MRAALKRSLARVGLLDFARQPSWYLKTCFGRINQKMIDAYIANNSTRKLHIGCAHHTMPGWLNTDYFVTRSDIAHFDATKTFPIPTASFDYIFSEHMIEHVSFDDGQSMLRECHRVLKPKGIVRISTPDLQFLIDLYARRKSALQQEYIGSFNPPCAVDAGGDAFVINHFVRAWGHLFIYDENTLRFAMERAGFKNIRRCGINESDVPALRNIEHEERSPPGFLRLETIAVEGVA
jgi:predicted SAM-dependent methyltransferase